MLDGGFRLLPRKNLWQAPGSGTGSWFLRLLGQPRAIGIVLLLGLLVVRVWDPPPVSSLRLNVFDYYQTIQPRPSLPSNILVVDVDEPSLARHGQWPWPRTLLAQLVTNLFEAGVEAVAFDIVFAEPDRTSPPRLAEEILGLDEQTRNRLRTMPDHDVLFADTFKNHSVVVSGSGLSTPSPTDHGQPPRKPPIVEIGTDPQAHLPSFQGLLRTIPVLEHAASGHGIISLTPEPDGVVRRVPALLRVGSDVLPTLSLELLRVATKELNLSVYTNHAGIESVALSQIRIPTDRLGRMWVHYAEPNWNRFFSAADVLDGTISAQNLTGKIVLIGTSAVGLGDIHVTPIHGSLPGVEVHAQILDMMLTQSFLTRSHLAMVQELLTTLVLGLFVILVVPFFGAVGTLLISALVAVGLLATSWYWYTNHGVLIDVTFGAIGLFGLYSVLSFLNYVREEHTRQHIRIAFSRYVSPMLVEKLTRQPGHLKLGGETKEMTLLFCDVRDFTSISERFQSDPQALTQLINRLFTRLTEAILVHDGTVDKYMGDTIMAFWNAPFDDADHAAHACAAALDMLKKLDLLNKAQEAEALASDTPVFSLKIGIGINTGSCVVGNLGSEQRFNYSVLGDSVNIASRLEGQSKVYGVSIVVGSRTADLIRDRFALLEVDRVLLKGKEDSARIFGVLGDEALAQDSHFQALAEAHAAMLSAYRLQQWSQAETFLDSCRINPHAPSELYMLYTTRIAHYRHQPPPLEWDGVFVATSK